VLTQVLLRAYLFHSVQRYEKKIRKQGNRSFKMKKNVNSLKKPLISTRTSNILRIFAIN
jgi:hypothetical protein